MREITKEHGGTPPEDLNEQIYERIDPRSKKLADQFRKDLERPVPAGQNKLITALQAIAGSAAGIPGKLLGSKAGKALVGGIAGGPTGALIGSQV